MFVWLFMFAIMCMFDCEGVCLIVGVFDCEDMRF